MRVLLIAMALAGGCADSKVDDRLASLERDIEQLKEAAIQGRTNDEALRSVFGRQIANLTAALVEVRLIETDGETPITGWWCDQLLCSRTRGDCETVRGIFKDKQTECAPARLAYCYLATDRDSTKARITCLPSLKTCAAMPGATGSSCMAVE